MTKKRATAAGRKPFEPTPEQRQLVTNLVGIGLPEHQIRQAIPWGKADGKPLDKRTFDKAFALELDRGVAIGDMKLRKRLYDAAVEDGNIAALIFLAKARLGMKETQIVENTGKDGTPLPAPIAGPILYLPAKDPDPLTRPAPNDAEADSRRIRENRLGIAHADRNSDNSDSDNSARPPAVPPLRAQLKNDTDASSATIATCGGLQDWRPPKGYDELGVLGNVASGIQSSR